MVYEHRAKAITDSSASGLLQQEQHSLLELVLAVFNVYVLLSS